MAHTDGEKRMSVADLDRLLSPESPVTYWQDGRPVPRREVFDDCEVIKLELDTRVVSDLTGHKKTCIAVYVGKRPWQRAQGHIQSGGGVSVANPLLRAILETLPQQPRSPSPNDDPGFWTDGEEILCPTETEREVVAEFLRDLFSEHYATTVGTGYHDMVGPEKRDHAGFYYIDFNRKEV